MVDAAASDLLPIIQKGSSTSSTSPKLSSEECCKINEDSGSQRSLSPVLNSNNSHRTLIYKRKRGRTKSRVKLTRRFSSCHDVNTEHNAIESETLSGSFSRREDYINKTLDDIQNFKSDNVEDRLANIREFEKQKRKFLDCLYIPKETKTFVSDRKPRLLSTSDEFNFKKPVSPIKKFKPSVNMLPQDCKTIHRLSVNNKHVAKQDLNNSFESNKANILGSVEESDLKFQGFCTGSGKNIVISPDALKKNVELFGDILDINEVTPRDHSYTNSYLDSHNKTMVENVYNKIPHLKSGKTCLLYEAEEYTDNQTVDKDELNNAKEVSFMHTSMSDTQLIQAADVALLMMDKNVLVAPSSTNTTVELASSSIKNDCDVLLSPVKPVFIESEEDKSMKIKRINKKLNAKGCMAHHLHNIVNKGISTACDEENNFKGFTMDECSSAQQLYNNHSKFIKEIVNVIQCNSVNKNKEKGLAIVETNQAVSNDLQQLMDTRISITNGKHALSSMCTIPSKKFKYDNVDCDLGDYFKGAKTTSPLTKTSEPKLINNHSKTSGDPTTISTFSFSSSERSKPDCIDSSECGFRTASKKPIKMLPSSMKNAQRMYEQICETGNTVEGGLIDVFKETPKEIPFANSLESKNSETSAVPATINPKYDTTDFSECGFKTASKKPIKMLPSSVKKAQYIYEQVCKTENPTDCTQTDNIEERKDIQLSDLSPAELTNVQKKKVIPQTMDMAENPTEYNEINKEFLKKTGQENHLKDASPLGFSTAGGKTIEISDNAWHKASSIFIDKEVSSSLLIRNNEFDELTVNDAADSKTVTKISYISTDVNGFHQNNAKEEDLTSCAGGFTTGSGMKIKISKGALQKSETLFADEDLSSSLKQGDVKDLADEIILEKTRALVQPGDDVQKANKVHHEDRDEEQNIQSFSKSHHGCTISKISNSASSKQQCFGSPRNSTKTKRLGLSACKQILIANDKLQKAKSIFEEDSDSNQSGVSRNTSLNTPVRFKPAEIHSSTPLKEVHAFRGSNFEAGNGSTIIKANTLDNIDITPVKKPCVYENITINRLVLENKRNSAIIIQEQIETDIKKRLEQFNNEYEDLANKMKVILEKKRALELQEQLIRNADDVHRRQKPGILMAKKMSSSKISLRELCGKKRPGNVAVNEAQDLDIPKQVLEVTPKNAEYVHFNCSWKNDSEKHNSILCTVDGAVIIPNARDLVSLTEISTAFEAMPGVDPRLVPKKWISNHFKWIVWKLASLQRNYPALFFNCLSVENVIQQLKYRYDREIDRTERPALRRILEKDDIPQKRMILCVSDIIEVSNNVFQLELTDGWYCIQTLIDQPLCRQIVASKIVIGTKLVVQCAEILNCDGCHPLEAPSDVRLKINYNCTRRAPWYSKLGYQRTAEPFLIGLATINSDGGTIGMVKIHIIRVYPLRYMERQAGKTVWRNKKAEDKRAQEWANARMREMEMIHQKVQEDYEKEMNSTQRNALGKIDCNQISEISSPKLLYQMLENTNDPEGFKNMMSSSQIASAMEYRSNIYAHHQQEVASRIAKEVKNLKSSYREVTSVLKLRIVDGNSHNSLQSFAFNIWKPTEEHLQLLKEGERFTVYNILPKPNGDLAANTRTHFKRDLPLPLINSKVLRQTLSISKAQDSTYKPVYNEYDTVGTVVQLHKDIHCQDLWLTDSVGRLLHIKIFEGPELCCLLDNLNRGASVAVMNLTFRHPRDMFGQARANQCTIITGYPQSKIMQDYLTEYCKQLPEDLTSLLNECDKKIEVCVANAHVTRNTSSLIGMINTSENVTDIFDDSSEDNTLIPSRLTTTDVAMSLIDTDQFL